MKLITPFTAFLTFAALSVGSPTPDEGQSLAQRANVLEARKGCSGTRASSDKCYGKRLGPQNSFHNWYVTRESLSGPSLVGQRLKNRSKNRDGKCCAKNKDGSGGLDASKGQGREDCGFCFTGKCKA